MRIGIYNRWLHTLGGGERHMGAVAGYLAQQHQVDIITHQPMPVAEMESRLGLNLGSTRIISVPLDVDYSNVSALTRSYDLFINASHLDLYPSFAKTSVQLVYFPAELPSVSRAAEGQMVATAKEVKKRLASWLLEESAEIGLLSGFGKPDRAAGIHFRPASAAAALLVPYQGKGDLNLRLKLRVPQEREAGRSTLSFRVGGQALPFQLTPTPGVFERHDLTIPSEWLPRRPGKVLLEVLSSVLPEAESGRLGGNPRVGVEIAWVKLAQPRWREIGSDLLLRGDLWYIQNWHRPPAHPLASYARIWANSEYTRRWVARYWDRAASVLYPPCDPICQSRPAAKRNLILSVGRFFAGSHSKKHIPMIRAFKSMCDAGFSGWEYHLVGGYYESDATQAEYVAAVEREAQGYPVHVRRNLPADDLKVLFGESKIFWHATGLDENEEDHPERFEHFGITTVEAMSAWCVPVVIGKAGQLEIVRHGVDGFLWKTVEELKAYTAQLAADDSLREKLAEKARARSQDFAMPAFERTLCGLVSEMNLG